MNNEAFECDGKEERDKAMVDQNEKKSFQLKYTSMTSCEILKTLRELEEAEMNRKRPGSLLETKVVEKNWAEYDEREKMSFIMFAVLKIILFVVLLYFFLLSLKFMTIGFTMVSSNAMKAQNLIRIVLANPFAALAIGIVFTAILQNSTAMTSIAVSMVGAGIIPDVQSAIPIIIGANIGTCVTNSLIALTLSGDPNEFKRAFSAATLNDIFNLLTAIILLPIEIFSQMVYRISAEITNLIPFDNIDAISKVNFMASLLDPICDLIILLDHKAVDAVANGARLNRVAMRCCESILVQVTDNNRIVNEHDNTTSALVFLSSSSTSTLSSKLLALASSPSHILPIPANSTLTSLMSNTTSNQTEDQIICLRQCHYLSMPMLKAYGDGAVGLFFIVLSVAVLIVCLFSIVRVISLFIAGPIAKGLNKAINASFPGKFAWLTDVVHFILAFGLTLIVQSSNIITATLVPLCGIGIVTLQRVYVMTLGSNIGTTVTAILTAFASPPTSLKKSMQVAFVCTLFNLFGVLFWLPVPILRFPIRLSTALGNIVLKYPWFLFLYISSVYFFGPVIIFGLTLLPYFIKFALFIFPVILLMIIYSLVKIFQQLYPKIY